MEHKIAFKFQPNGDILHYKVEKLLSNNRAELVSEAKAPPIIYYDKLYDLQEGIDILKQIKFLEEEHLETILGMTTKLKENILNILK